MPDFYRDTNDWYIGYYRGSNYHFAVFFTLAMRWPRRAN